jgi:hypothetical protein
MKRVLIRALQLVTLFVLVLALIFTVYVWRTWDRAYDEYPMPNVRASSDPAIIARGEYLVYGPAHCVECHASSFGALSEFLRSLPPAQGAEGEVTFRKSD